MRPSSFDQKGRLQKICAIPECPAHPTFSNDCNMRAGIAGHWWCHKHWKDVQAARISVPVWQNPHKNNRKKQGRLF